jgi:hypothetical protein
MKIHGYSWLGPIHGCRLAGIGRKTTPAGGRINPDNGIFLCLLV